MQVGDILYCKKDFYFNETCFVTKNKHYIISHYAGGYLSMDSVIKDRNSGIDFVDNREDVIDDDMGYVWDHFETKIEKAKRIIKQYEER